MATYSFIGANQLIGIAQPPIEVINRGESSFKADLLSVYEGIQTDRTTMLAQVRELQLAAQLLLDAEAKRIAVFAPNDDRIAALVASGQTILDRVGMLDAEVDVATTRVPMVTKTEALLHGRITDDANRSAGPVTVTLTDEKGTPVPGVAPVEVDSAGYYAIVVPADVAAAVGADRKLGLVVSNGADRVAAGVAPLTLSAGTVQVQDVQLPASALDALRLRLPVQSLVGGGALLSPRGAKARPTKTAAKRGPGKSTGAKRRGGK
ncbi:MAG: hypothetical protein ABI460_14795 [Caldimonas sp.]